MGINLCDLELGKEFLDRKLNGHSMKEKISDKSNFFEIENVSSVKGELTIKKMKRQVID